MTVITKPTMLAEHKTGECITVARCSACGMLIYGPFFLEQADNYNEKMRRIFEAHLRQEHQRER